MQRVLNILVADAVAQHTKGHSCNATLATDVTVRKLKCFVSRGVAEPAVEPDAAQ